jgi:sulfatase maturation enzyme AslB (radical SAM superfamily)
MSCTETFYKGYYMITNRCNLDCGYCVLEDAPEQLRRELDVAGKKDLISHLYHRLGFRRITLSGGEALLIGKRPPAEFVSLLGFLRGLKSTDQHRNLEIELYTNGTLLNDSVADAMAGVVDLVAITIDSSRDETLTVLGRNTGRYHNYFQSAVDVCSRLASRGIAVKLHSVVGQATWRHLPDEVGPILDAIMQRGGRVSQWKFYQYMSYDAPDRDGANAITTSCFQAAAERIQKALATRDVRLHFKDNNEMNASLFNILSYGTAQYMRPGDTWSTSVRTGDLRTYSSMADLFSKHDIDQKSFSQFHGVKR